MRQRRWVAECQHGLALMLVLILLAVVLLLSLAGARNALLGEKASRNDRDRQQALRAAEGALLDAEADILRFATGVRREVFDGRVPVGLAPGACHGGRGNPLAGICVHAPTVMSSVSLLAGPAEAGADDVATSYGQHTGRSMSVGAGPLPAQLPRYIIEILEARPERAGVMQYRITAAGFGARPASRVVLQSQLRIVHGQARGQRYAWREITDWSNNAENEQ